MDVFRLLGWNIRELRLAQNLTQEKFAGLANIAEQASVSELEHGKGNPTLQTIADISIALNVSIPDLFSKDGVPSEILDAPTRTEFRI
jgi:transcriptional regulator with XRE-family HTH domain